MSRVAKNPIALPKGVEVNLAGTNVTVKGPLGSLTLNRNPAVDVLVEGEQLVVKAVAGAENANALSGTTRALLANLVNGVSKGFEKKLTLVGVGYRAAAQGDTLNLSLGFSHPVAHKMPAGVKVETPSQTEVLIKGIDKQQVGQVAAEIRAYRKPEP